MHQNLDDIAELAEDLGNRYFMGGKVNLEKIATVNNIHFITSNYGNYFLGQLVHYEKRFYILLNSDQLNQNESGRVRFTIAHELGHYFIDEHRTQLAKGISLSFKGGFGEQECKKTDKSANHFAANLLMPKNHFIHQATKLEQGLAGIFALKCKYNTSIESTVNHYINLDLSLSVIIKWKADYTYQYAWCSKSFSVATGLDKFPLPIRHDPNYIMKQVELINTSGSDYIESATQLSRWISTVMQGTIKDILGLEQTVKLGDFGGITLLTFQ